MKQNSNNNRNENSNATRAMVASVKAMINAEYLQRVDLVKYGIQVFAAYLDNEEPREYYVIIAAERDIKTGRYYFIDRDGVRIAWSRLNADTLAYACRDFIDQMNADQSTEERADGVTVYNNVTRERLAEICTTIAEAVGVLSGSTFPAFDIKIDLQHFDKWTAPTLADDRTDPRAPFFFAVRHQGAESGTLEHITERCNVLGRPVYVIKADHATDADGHQFAGRYNIAVKVDPKFSRDFAELERLTQRESEPTEPAAAAEPTNTNPEHTEPESEPQSEPKAPTLAEIAADYTAGTADSIRRRWQSFKAKAARVALAVAPWLGVGLILGLTLAVFVIAILNVPAWVERLPILPRAFVGCLFIFLPTLGAEMLIIKVFAAIDAKTGFFGFNPLACR
jgi:hypothetical protein